MNYTQRECGRERELYYHEEETVPVIQSELEEEGEDSSEEAARELYAIRFKRGDYYDELLSPLISH